jgi:hypothetical protein
VKRSVGAEGSRGMSYAHGSVAAKALDHPAFLVVAESCKHVCATVQDNSFFLSFIQEDLTPRSAGLIASGYVIRVDLQSMRRERRVRNFDGTMNNCKRSLRNGLR